MQKDYLQISGNSDPPFCTAPERGQIRKTFIRLRTHISLGIREFARGLDEILVVEEKRQMVEYQLKEQLYNWREDVRPRVIGTYKILYNDAVAMTGGQPVDGPISVFAIAKQMAAEGVARIALVTEDLGRYADRSRLPAEVTLHSRDDLAAVQRELREVSGISVLIYDQTCAAEKRRRRKKKEMTDPPERLFINELVCEGCGDCGVQSNCTSLLPKETEFGRKRAIDQSSCNKDYSCVKGFCPSFVTVKEGRLRTRKTASAAGGTTPSQANFYTGGSHPA